MTTTMNQEQLEKCISTLTDVASEIRSENHAGWGNALDDVIESLKGRQLVQAEPVAYPSEIITALGVAANALKIASDWSLPDIQCNPPKEWNLPTGDDSGEDGWCSTYALAEKLRKLASQHPAQKPADAGILPIAIVDLLREVHAKFKAYELAVGEPPPHEHRTLMHKIERALVDPKPADEHHKKCTVYPSNRLNDTPDVCNCGAKAPHPYRADEQPVGDYAEHYERKWHAVVAECADLQDQLNEANTKIVQMELASHPLVPDVLGIAYVAVPRSMLLHVVQELQQFRAVEVGEGIYDMEDLDGLIRQLRAALGNTENSR